MSKAVATNKKAYRDFHIMETWECGIVLTGPEVKSIRGGYVNFKDTFARLDKEEVFLHNLHITAYVQASYMNEDADRVRKLLLNKREIKKIMGKVTQKGLVLVPTKVYFNKRNLVKVEIALGKGKKLHDKRESIKKKDVDLDMKRAMRHNR